MQARDLMVAGPNVVTVTSDDSIYTAIRLMLKKGISGLPVVETGPLDTRKLVGIVTEGDFLRRRETKTLGRLPRWLEFLAGPGKLAEEYVHASSRKIADIMTRPVIVDSFHQARAERLAATARTVAGPAAIQRRTRIQTFPFVTS